MKTENRMYSLMIMMAEMASNVAVSEKNGLSYDVEEFEEDFDSLVEKIYDELKERKEAE